MPEWTTKQDELLATYANLGPEWCAGEIARRFGVHRSTEATRRHIYRLGISARRFDICTECGKPISKAGGDGLCRSCHVKQLAEAQRRIADRVEQDAVEPCVQREYARQRKRVSRGRSLSQTMSHSRSTR